VSGVQDGTNDQGMSTAEQRVSSGFPVGNPSGVNSGLTPSTEQVAQAKSFAGGKVTTCQHSWLQENFYKRDNRREKVRDNLREKVSKRDNFSCYLT
jgi:hypothetical protein